MKSMTYLGSAIVALALLIGSSVANTAAAGDLPDLLIRSVDLYPTGKCGAVGSAIKGKVTIKNVGDRRARALVFTPLIKVFDIHNEEFRDNDIKINSLAPGETTTVRINIGRFHKKRYYGGLRKIIIHVDPKDKIRESNELNNTFAVKVPVYC